MALFLLSFCLSSCALKDGMRPRRVEPAMGLELFTLKENDYRDLFASFSKILLENAEIKIQSLSPKSTQYLAALHRQIVRNNELLLDPEIKPRFYIIRDKSPYFFSLPGGQYFFSSDYVLRFIVNEEVLVASLTHEMIRSHRSLYVKSDIVPTGVMTIERILALTRLPLEARQEIHKLSFVAVRRAGFDPSSILNWLQNINKNSLLFSMQLGDPRLVSREEFAFKNFLVSQNITEIDFMGRETNSSAGFYEMLNNLRVVQ